MIIRFEGLKNSSQKRKLFQFCKKVCAVLKPLKRKGETCVVFVSDRQIRRLNKNFLNHDRTTDVVAFNYPGQTGVKSDVFPYGDIYISLDTARRKAKEGKYLLDKELALMILHGLLHLSGYRDKKPRERERMFHKQTVLFRQLNPQLAPPDLQ